MLPAFVLATMLHAGPVDPALLDVCFDRAAMSSAPKDQLATCAKAYTDRCTKKEFESCTLLGDARAAGRGVSTDVDEAIRLYRKACDGGEGTGCARLGMRLLLGRGTRTKTSAGLEALGKGCDLGALEACYDLGIAHRDGVGTKKDLDRADELLANACQSGHIPSCGAVGDLRIAQENPLGAAKSYRIGCDAHDLEACNGLADAAAQFARGIGAPRDFQRAHALAKAGCDGGGRRACTYLGWLTDRGLGTQRDSEAAQKLYANACEKGDANACFNAASALASEDGEKSGALFARACTLGMKESCNLKPAASFDVKFSKDVATKEQ